MSKSVALLLVKAHSNRLPQKNTRDFNGKPMFLVNVEKCLKLFEEVYVSSDSDEIINQATRVGAIGIKRPDDLCGDTPNIPVYRHAMRYMGYVDNIIAVQANSPTVDINTIALVKRMMEDFGIEEIMTCHPDYSIYGSVWGIYKYRLTNYGDPYHPTPDVLVVDNSVDIHTQEDYEAALKQI